MERSGLARFVPIVLVLIVIIVAIVALVSLGRALFSGTGSGETATPVNTSQQALTSTLADRSVRMTVRGPIVAEEQFNSYVVSVGPSARSMATYVGYVGQQINNEQLPNNTQAYDQFVHALDRAGLAEGKPLTGEANDTRGICATGLVYEFDIMQGDNSVQKLWTSTCDGSRGSLTASVQQVSRLFRLQIPSFSQLIRGLNMNT